MTLLPKLGPAEKLIGPDVFRERKRRRNVAAKLRDQVYAIRGVRDVQICLR